MTGSLLGAACSTGAETVAVEGAEVDASGQIPTTSIATRRTTTTTTAPAPTTPVNQQAQLDATFASVLSQIAANPQLAATIGALQNADLAAMFDVDGDLLTMLGIDAAAVQGLGALLMSAAQEQLAQLVAGGAAGLIGAGAAPATPAVSTPAPTVSVAPPTAGLVVIGQLLELVREINGEAITSINGLSPELIRSLSGLVAGVNPADLQSISALLKLIDPEGLGKLSEQSPGAAAVLAVIAGALLANDPAVANGLREGQDPNSPLMAVLAHIEKVAGGIPSDVAFAVLQVGLSLQAEQLEALGKLLAVLANPTTRDLLNQILG